ncbi:MAG: hypothetical protein EA362_12570 [Saprospirales bacterium]|nr:MAG: hypothetical protein EA362_12570 [Saprospirales bacterium]
MKTIILMAMAVLMTFNVHAQNQMRQGERQLTPQQKDRIESQRIAFISSKLELSPAQAEKFWPRYNEYYAAQQELRGEVERITDDEIRNLSESEARTKIQNKLEIRQSELDRDKSFFKEMESILTPNQVLILSRVDGEFRRHMIRQVRSTGQNERLQNRQRHRSQQDPPARGQQRNK